VLTQTNTEQADTAAPETQQPVIPDHALVLTLAAAQILQHAKAIGLPLPRAINISKPVTNPDLDPDKHPPLGLTFDTFDELAAWARYMDSEIEERSTYSSYMTRTVWHYNARGDFLEQRINVTALPEIRAQVFYDSEDFVRPADGIRRYRYGLVGSNDTDHDDRGNPL
jgi:hypothetical protein